MCPSRTLAEDDGEAADVVRWWVASTRFDGMSGMPSGPPEWPFKGGILNQPGKLVDAVDLLRGEWSYVLGAARSKKKAQPAQRARR